MNQYEGMFIFLDSLKDEDLETVIKRVRGEIEKLDGTIDAVTRLGRRQFARTLYRQGKGRYTAGHYVVINFQIPAAAIAPLRERFRLIEELFRFQIFRTERPPAREEAAHGVAE